MALTNRYDQDVYFAQGCELFESKRYAEALKLFEKMEHGLQKTYCVGTCRMEMGTEEDLLWAFKCFDSIGALSGPAVKNNLVSTVTRLASIYEEQDKQDFSLELMLNVYNKHVKDNHVLNYNIGRILEKRGMATEALRFLKAALEQDGTIVDYYLEMNLALKGTECNDEKRIQCLLDGLKKSKIKEPLFKELGNILVTTDTSKAIEMYMKALTPHVNPQFAATVYMNIGNCYIKQCDVAKGMEYYSKSISLDADFESVLHNYAMAALYNHMLTEAQLWQINQEIGFKMIKFHKSPQERHIPAVKEKIAIGFLSADLLGNHPVVHFAKRMLTDFDPSKYNVYCYTNNFFLRPNITTQLPFSSEIKWHEIKNMSTIKASNLIASHNLDILVDLSGYTEGNRCDLMSNRLAPTQICYIGYPFHPGMCVDYFVGDQIMKPVTEELLSKMYVMPSCYTHYTPPFIPKSSELVSPLASKGFITFGAFNKPNKTNEQVLDLYHKVLQAVPESRLLLKTVHMHDLFLKKYPEFIDKNRVNVVGIVDGYENYIGLFNRVDISLDTFPWSGTTTTCESLLMGTPVITYVPKNCPYHQKSTASILYHSGLKNFICDTVEKFVNTAVACAKNIPKLPQFKRDVQKTFLEGGVVKGDDYMHNLDEMFHKLKK